MVGTLYISGKQLGNHNYSTVIFPKFGLPGPVPINALNATPFNSSPSLLGFNMAHSHWIAPAARFNNRRSIRDHRGCFKSQDLSLLVVNRPLTPCDCIAGNGLVSLVKRTSKQVQKGMAGILVSVGDAEDAE